ncbi:guanine deaminase [Anguilla rostrata]|uniref:guanine deaminase n=1 Tax=Anguilla rostrata TaxID=7938 RepID=UPI0030D57312
MTSNNETVSDIARVYRGTFVHSTQNAAVEILEDTILGVDTEGRIAFIGAAAEVAKLAETWGFRISDVRHLGPRFFMPGLVDTHIHASQYSYTGTALDLPLLKWLETYTFPTEVNYKDLDFAQDVYTKVVKRTLRNGTTTACYFATIYTDSSLLLGEIADKYGQRALVGKVCMDANNAVPLYKETVDHSTKETNRFIGELLKRKYALVRPIVTPRFALSCTPPLLSHLGEIAKNNDLHIQSHISENKEEVALVKKQFSDSESYAEVYHKHNLLTDKTVMAHGCYLTDSELELFRETGTAISHCPNSNISLCSGMLDVRRVLKHKVKLGLGTDVAGGYSPSMLDAIRRAVDTSKVLNIQDAEHKTLTFEEVFRLATLGGSEALSLQERTGNFQVGKDFDALLINPLVPDSPFDMFPNESTKGVLEKFLNLGDDRNIEEVYVAGRKVIPFQE